MDKILRKKHIKSPVQHHEHFLFKSRQFQQVNRPPQPPSNEAGKVHAEDDEMIAQHDRITAKLRANLFSEM